LFGSPATASGFNGGKSLPGFVCFALPVEYHDDVTTAQLQDYTDTYLFQTLGKFTPAMSKEGM